MDMCHGEVPSLSFILAVSGFTLLLWKGIEVYLYRTPLLGGVTALPDCQDDDTQAPTRRTEIEIMPCFPWVGHIAGWLRSKPTCRGGIVCACQEHKAADVMSERHLGRVASLCEIALEILRIYREIGFPAISSDHYEAFGGQVAWIMNKYMLEPISMRCCLLWRARGKT